MNVSSLVYRILMVVILGVISPWLKANTSSLWYVALSVLYLIAVVVAEIIYRKWIAKIKLNRSSR